MTIKINDILVFNPESFEDFRIASENENDIQENIFCCGMKDWKGKHLPFVRVFGINDVESCTTWSSIDIPCSINTCMLIIEKQNFRVKLLPLNEDYSPIERIDNIWIDISVLQKGIDLKLIKPLS
jgi:hypothetical protein